MRKILKTCIVATCLVTSVLIVPLSASANSCYRVHPTFPLLLREIDGEEVTHSDTVQLGTGTTVLTFAVHSNDIAKLKQLKKPVLKVTFNGTVGDFGSACTAYPLGHYTLTLKNDFGHEIKYQVSPACDLASFDITHTSGLKLIIDPDPDVDMDLCQGTYRGHVSGSVLGAAGVDQADNTGLKVFVEDGIDGVVVGVNAATKSRHPKARHSGVSSSKLLTKKPKLSVTSNTIPWKGGGHVKNTVSSYPYLSDGYRTPKTNNKQNSWDSSTNPCTMARTKRRDVGCSYVQTEYYRSGQNEPTVRYSEKMTAVTTARTVRKKNDQLPLLVRSF
ncbi:MAG: hypothetical protein LBJ19_01495 [Holosporaceae bacterium]|jgi:hypothetical protein|nr:hypothetical protein [Holosporaceae bacterium]